MTGPTVTVTVTVRIQPSIIDEETNDQVACEDRCVIRVGGIGTAGASSAPLPGDIPITFASAEPSAPLTPPSEPEVPAPAAEPTAPLAPSSEPAPPGTAPSPSLPCTNRACTTDTVPPSNSTTTSDPCDDSPGQGPSPTCVPGLTVPE